MRTLDFKSEVSKDVIPEPSVSHFWSGVKDHPRHLEPDNIIAQSLEQAALEACLRDDLGVAFRRNRELIDVDSRFRRFRFRDQVYIAKFASHEAAERERRNAHEVKRRLASSRSKSFILEPVVPILVTISSEHSALITPDLGFTLHENPSATELLLHERALIDLMRHILDRGIEWAGLVPRNLVYDATTCSLWLLDFEEVQFFTPGAINYNTLVSFVWTLNWGQIHQSYASFPQQIEAQIFGNVEHTEPGLDTFESTYCEITGQDAPLTEIRQTCCAATIVSESPLTYKQSGWLTPFEMGHLVDDVFPQSLSVLYTFASARLRKEYGDARYAEFLSNLLTRLQQAIALAGGTSSLSLDVPFIKKQTLLGFFDCLLKDGGLSIYSRMRESSPDEHCMSNENVLMRAVSEFDQLRSLNGWNAAVRRATLLDTILSVVVACIFYGFNVREPLDLLVRGSLGHGLVSRLSDVDFELSGPQSLSGHRGFERVTSEALALLGIEAEGSQDRPQEVDLRAAKGLTRDLHEWMELRRPGSAKHDPGWLKPLFSNIPPDLWRKSSQYEQVELPLTPKILFFEARALIARLGVRYGFGLAMVEQQLEQLQVKLPPGSTRELSTLLENCLAIYEQEEHPSHSDILELGNTLNESRFAFKLPKLRLYIQPDQPVEKE